MSQAPSPPGPPLGPLLTGYISHERFSDFLKSNTVGAEYLRKLEEFRACARMGILPRLTPGGAPRFGSARAEAEVKKGNIDFFHWLLGRYGSITINQNVES